MLHQFKQDSDSVYPFSVVKVVQEVPIPTPRVGELGHNMQFHKVLLAHLKRRFVAVQGDFDRNCFQIH